MDNQNFVRNTRQVLDIDLNISPPSEDWNDGGVLNNGLQESTQPPVIDLEAIDDDVVIISSPRAFEEASRNSRRNQRRPAPAMVDVESGSSRVRRRTGTTIINCDTRVNVEGENSSTGKTVTSTVVPPVPPPVREELKFDCPICMSEMVEETSTKCGHVFCKACIKDAIAIQQKCPTCRRKTTRRDIFRIYLPATQNP